MNDNKVEVYGVLAELAYLKLENDYFNNKDDGGLGGIISNENIENILMQQQQKF